MSLRVDATDPTDREDALIRAVNAVKGGRLVVLPTDTVYGIGCDAFDNQAVEALLRAKRRGPDMPVPVLIGSWSTVEGLVREYSFNLRRLVEAFWPGGLSVVVHQAPSLPWNLGDTRGTVMLRMPLHPVALELLQRTGPMAVSSANISGQPPAVTVAQAEEQLGGEVGVYMDGGTATVGSPSTIVDLSSGRPRILREGATSAEEVGEVLGMSPAQLRGQI
ncbi:L-threonylcarbamoyladenylate synthase [Corynebacterium heidelbergense]|uniref:L-threonylcarbamoyladenylate synthase n=1 Tax=Corynebacterium heidelbergense TaxID=2055947 RepID=A0A364VCG0_9CORY|nr:L-threonylcarbamoyladenylate synthase [Corynebacterium heidelbergense]RAV34314.1 threonylcarbamoyl-AMP synthase [Corynebacterium heidelbergense]WCZ36905.1 Threonylcarbamoyl-AMP synthase [Corynebacterium heidelbergense]